MRKTIYNNLHRIIALAAVLIIIIAAVLGTSYGTAAVYAESYVGENDYDYTSVLDDLDGATINGKTFNVKDYAATSKEETQVLTFTEYCYSCYENQQGNYALYVYVWNPQGLDISTGSTLNKISLRFGDDTSANYSKYRLYFCNRSTGDYQGLFYKFKVYLTSDNKTDIFNTLNSGERVYTVSEIELLTSGNTNATAYYVSTTYKYTGYAAGYGSNITSASTLSITQEQADTLTLNNVGTAYYRPEGTNGTNDYTQDSLQSVYFAVPNSYVEKYGALVGLSAEWLEAVLYPMLVTADSTAYENVYSYLGEDVTSACENDDDFRRAFMGLNSYTMTPSYSFYCNYSYGIFPSSSGTSLSFDFADNDLLAGNVIYYENDYWLNRLYSIYLKEDYDSESCSEVVSSAEILAELERATNAQYRTGYSLVADKYASYLFSSYNRDYTQFSIDMRDEDNTVSLTSQKISSKWWQKIFKDKTVDTTTFDDIPVLQALTDDDFSSSNTDAVNAQSLYVSEADYSDLKEYYKEWSTKTTYTAADGTVSETDGYTIFICRYDVSDYSSATATLLRKGTYSGRDCWYLADNNATNNYFFQETVYLDFDIIDVTFTNGETDTVIGVVNSPIDIASASTSPVNTSGGNNDSCSGISWELVLGIVLLVVLLIICAPILPYVAKFIIWVISLPFKLIAKLCKSISSSAKERKQNKESNNKKE